MLDERTPWNPTSLLRSDRWNTLPRVPWITIFPADDRLSHRHGAAWDCRTLDSSPYSPHHLDARTYSLVPCRSSFESEIAPQVSGDAILLERVFDRSTTIRHTAQRPLARNGERLSLRLGSTQVPWYDELRISRQLRESVTGTRSEPTTVGWIASRPPASRYDYELQSWRSAAPRFFHRESHVC